MPFAVIGSSGTIELVNERLLELTGCERHDLVGASWIDRCPEERDGSTGRDHLRLARGGAPQQYSVQLRCADGTRRRMKCSVNPVRMDADLYLLAALEDAPVAPPPRLARCTIGYVVSTLPDTLGRLLRAESGTPMLDAAVEDGKTCYAALAQRDRPCVGCPAFDASLTETGRQAVLTPRGVDSSMRLVEARADGPGRAVVVSLELNEALLRDVLRARVDAHATRARLSERERQVLYYLALGRSRADIALLLNISQRTVKFHQENLLAKLGAESALDLLRLFL